MRVVVFLLACHGITQIVTGGKIFQPVRALVARISATAGYWIKCPMCFGLPVGVMLAAAGLWPWGEVGTTMRGWPGCSIDLFVAGVVSSGFCWTAHVLLHKLGADEL
jgi:hypothetical protein